MITAHTLLTAAPDSIDEPVAFMGAAAAGAAAPTHYRARRNKSGRWRVEVGALDMYYLREHDDAPVVVATLDEVDSLIDRVRDRSSVAAPIVMDVHLAGDPYSQGLDVGISKECGVVRYSGREWPGGVVTVGEGSSDGDEKSYFYMGSWRGFPADSEIALDLVRDAVKEFMRTDGARPTCVRRRPEP